MTVNLKRFAYGQIRTGLLAGKFPVGSTLSPANLSRELGISRTPVREAISQLETEGFVEQMPRLGHQVRKVERDELAELFDLRKILEQGAVLRSVQRISAAEIEKLWESCKQYGILIRSWRNASDSAARGDADSKLCRLDIAFHLRLLAAAQNRRLMKLVADLQLMTSLFRWHVEMPIGPAFRRWTHTHREHCRIVQSLARRDAVAAVAALGRHIDGSAAYHLQAFDHGRQCPPPNGAFDEAWSAAVLASFEPDAPATGHPARAARRQMAGG